MDATLLIDAIVRQTTVLVAQLATAAGVRTPLAHTANQVFLDLVTELKRQGLGNKVIADMFGLALRSYHSKVQRLAESQTFRGRSLLTAVLEYIQDADSVSRADVLVRFRQDDERVLRSVLGDLADSGLIFRSGRGDRTTFKARTDSTPGEGLHEDEERLAQLLWVTIHRFGPVSTLDAANHMHVEPMELERVLAHLVDTGRAERSGSDLDAVYRARECVIEVDDPTGWEASVFDHYQAVVTTICAKLRTGSTRAREDDATGGSTYAFDVWPGHPHYEEVAGYLRTVRQLSVMLRKKVESYNATVTAPPESAMERFLAYVGQTVIREEGSEREHNGAQNQSHSALSITGEPRGK